MPYYLVQATYTPEAWAAQQRNPRDRQGPAQQALAAVYGRLESFFYSFGEYDIVLIVEVPDNVSAAAISIAVKGTGAFTAFKTTPLLTVDEGLKAIRKAGESGTLYQPPTAAATV